ncbi:hypothetical protein ACIPLC_33270 [Kitasatospora sp. NPDC086801]|uniref:hypothetical protein n=1 Tax=Kitasatospora sp. NPDC086801 TaxID=3364066 RepID=UPI0038254EF1
MELTTMDSPIDIKLAATGEPARISFEPGGTAFEVDVDDFISLRLDSGSVSSIEIYHWPNGISVWLPYPGESDFIVLDSSGEEMARLW